MTNLDDMIELCNSMESRGRNSGNFATYMRQLIRLFSAHYGERFKVSLADFDAFIVGSERRAVKAYVKTAAKLGKDRANAFDLLPKDGYHDVLQHMETVPGLQIKLAPLAESWFTIQRSYLTRRRRKIQSKKTDVTALGYLNIYLFYYLPYWFADHPNTELKYPSEPRLLLASIFVSPILPHNFSIPLRLVEFFDELAERRKMSHESLYSYLKAIEGFFEYIEQYSNDLPGCAGFTQPLASHDFPPVTRLRGSKKRPIPRKLFAFYISYAESMVAYAAVLLERAIAGQITQEQLAAHFSTGAGSLATIDTFALADLMGYVPVVFSNGKYFPLRVLQNIFFADEKIPLKDGRHLRIPQPHGLIHILVVLYTGIRNQHIQWLDARTFDKSSIENAEFTKLHVNTDKVKRRPWDAYVNSRVIELLRLQKAWRDLVAHPGFEKELLYEGHSNTQWAPILPLFALDYSGAPHGDSRYSNAWDRVLMGVQGMLNTIGFPTEQVDTLVELLPEAIGLEDENHLKWEKFGPDSEWAKSLKLGDSRAYVVLKPKSTITPHSARIGVVNHYIHYLDAELIGRYITGQKKAVVEYYVNVEPEELAELQQQQAVALHTAIFGKDIEEMARSGGAPPSRYVKPDQVNASLVRSIRSQKIEETIALHGCISIVTNDEGRSGIDVLKETRGVGVAFNKTEVCPYANNCPPEVVKLLGGWHRCGLCPFAVRSIDHLQPIAARRRQIMENLESIESELEEPKALERYSEPERAAMAAERRRLGDEALGFKLSEEVLERQRQNIAAGRDTREWVVPMPDIIRENLSRVEAPTGEMTYLLARLSESVAYPSFDSPEIRAKFDLLRRQLLANTGNIREALTSPASNNPAAECIGQMKTLADANSIPYESIAGLLIEGMSDIQWSAPGKTLLIKGEAST